MNGKTALVTGASGFIGRNVVKELNRKGYKVKAGIHNRNQSKIFRYLKNVEEVYLDLNDYTSLNIALDNIDYVFHFAALVNSHESRENLNKINVEGTKNIWECTAAHKVKAALYCSSTAVYGLLSKSVQPIDEHVTPKAIEPYGNSKLLGEIEALKVAEETGLPTIIIRPVAVFGPNEHTPFGKKLKEAAVSKILLAGKLQKNKFNYVHVEDLALASIYLIENKKNFGEIFNIAVNAPVLFEDAFKSYIDLLNRIDGLNLKTKLIAHLSSALNKSSIIPEFISSSIFKNYSFTIWQPGFELLYSSEKLVSTNYNFKRDKFEDVLKSCLESA